METSIMLAEYPQLVDRSHASQGGPTPESDYRTFDMLQNSSVFLINEFDEISENGVLGMPEFATSEKGSLFLKAAADAVARFLDEFATWEFQTRNSGADEKRPI
jgi:creatinine amidohydrolase/Fe(II)-dependent formamide hydrolase-like protein